jgi:hypothetical protein
LPLQWDFDGTFLEGTALSFLQSFPPKILEKAEETKDSNFRNVLLKSQLADGITELDFKTYKITKTKITQIIGIKLS